MVALFQGEFQGQFAKMTIHNQWVCTTVNLSCLNKMHIKKEILIYSTTKVFLDRAVVELVYKFDEKSTTSSCKGESTAKLPLNGYVIDVGVIM